MNYPDDTEFFNFSTGVYRTHTDKRS